MLIPLAAPSQKALQDDIKEFEKELEVVDTDVVVKESETRNTKREKTTELNRLVSLKGDKENALNVLSMYNVDYRNVFESGGGGEKKRVQNEPTHNSQAWPRAR